MATPGGQAQAAVAAPPGQAAPRTDMAPVLQQLNLASLRTRTQDLHNAISRILHSFHTLPALKWSEVLGQFAMVNVELLNLVEDIKPILKMFVVYPKNVNAENATILPIMLSSKLLPEMEAEETVLKDKMLAGISNLPVQMQSEKIQRQIELVRSVCDGAEKVLGEARKVYGLSSRQGVAALATLDKQQAARIAEQEKLLRAASNSGEGLRISPDQQQAPQMLPPHLSSALGTSVTDTGASFQRGTSSALPPSGPLRPAAPQQQTNPAQILQRSNIGVPMQSLGGAGSLPGVGTAATTIPYVNSPRSGTGNFNVPSPQQLNTQTQQQQLLLRQQKIQQLQMQKQQQALQAQQNQQLRRPGTPPIPQAQANLQPQGHQVNILQLQQQQAKLQQNQLQQQLQQQQLQQQQQQQQQHYQQAPQLQQQTLQQQQQTLHNQLQNTQLHAAQQNALAQGSQGRNQLNQLGNMNPLYGNNQSSLLPPTMSGQSQALLQQRYLQGNASSQLYNMGNTMGSNMGNMVNTMGNPVGNTMGNTMGNTLGNAMGNTMGNTIGNSMGSVMGNTLGNNMGNTLGSNVANAIGNSLGNNMGGALGNPLGNMGMAGSAAQGTSTLALPLQQQLAGPGSYSGLLNTNQMNAFGQQRQHPPPQ